VTSCETNTIDAVPAPAPYTLWRASLTSLPSAADLQLLSTEERSASVRFSFARDARRYLAAHVALRKALASWVGTQPADLRFVTGRFGKPALAPTASCGFNMSRSGDVAIIAVSSFAEIGVDVELLRECPDALAVAALNFSASECEQLEALVASERSAAFLRCWTRREACLKAVGSGLSIAPQQFETGASPRRNSVAVPTPEGPVQVEVESLTLDAGTIVSVARTMS
jgi:4'-phosphopantetheinyl transferase